ncbi:MAG: Trk system potassium transporter TrkA [Lachnospiraceae bacterium]|nr:Trk system potassium transporter TrkA [Lachnospiraceae bacterium]MCI9095071.1 Trk system potassium transporter TrkA [Lachnospiraceae bacterium]MCI9203155.1 Trk system potassium transporter TrkA [Lachnospiraceae bacterium]
MKYHKDMEIFIVGGGEIGKALAVQLSRDGYELTIIDREESVVNSIGNTVDVISYQGNGASYTTLKELGADKADIFIAVTESDELNILSCLTAHMMGAKHAIARVRDVDYAGQNRFYRDKLGLSMTINPELATAMEIFRLLRFPLATRVEVFARGRAELVEMTVGANSPLNEKSLIQINQNMGINLLICAVVRNGDVYVPNGETVIRSGDILYMTGAPEEFRKSFKKLKLPIKPMQSVMISGAGRISCYLAGVLLKQGAKVTIVERNQRIADEVSAAMPKAAVLCDDTLNYFDAMSGTDISHTDAFIAMTEDDEYNLVAAMYAESQGINKVVSRINAKSRLKVLPPESRICTVSREDVAADRILGYSRSLLNAEDNDAVESLYRLMDGKIEFIEFKIDEKDRNLNIPLKDLKLKRNILLGCIMRDTRTIIPRGDDVLLPGDMALVVTIGRQIARLEDIFIT